MNETDRFYRDNAGAYVASGRQGDNRWRLRFVEMLPRQAEVLELGCGGGYDTAAMLAAGLRVTPTDGVAEMAIEAQKRLGIGVKVLRFGDIAFSAAFDGVFANACLLHEPRASLPAILSSIRRALRPQGLFYASFKAGEGEGVDGLGRYYNYPDEPWLRSACAAAGWHGLDIEMAEGSGYDRKPTTWLHVFAHA